MNARISQQQLEAYLWGAATLLRGTIDAGDYKQFIFPLLFYKRVCDVFDEETQAALNESGGDSEFAQYPENHRFQVPSDAHWRLVRQKATNVGRAVQEGMRAIETANPDKLFGIFGDAQWTNKDRLSDSMLRDLVEHFSTLDLTLANLPEDELGQGYEYLIKKFADDAGHTAAEFYTNRTVVHLMTEMLKPEPGESIYDPTCGSGGMLLSCITHLRRQGKEWRNVRLYGQERNLMTSSIARMNCFLHGIEEFRVERGDTLSEPKFVERDRLMQFDVVLANPPYSIKQWDRDAFASDPWGRNVFGTPPQGRADYAFWQHILQSLKRQTGRCAILFPHGVLFRQEEAEMRRRLIEADLIECVLGLGPNLFYNSPMEACVLVCRTQKPARRKGRILFINAVKEVTREQSQSFLTADHIDHIVAAYHAFADEVDFARVVSIDEVRTQGWNLNIPLYIVNAEYRRTELRIDSGSLGSLESAFASWHDDAETLRHLIETVLRENLSQRPPCHEGKLGIQKPSWLDKAKWRRFRFSEIASNSREMAQPTPADSATYIGLEHLDSGSLHVRRWGSEADLKGQKLRMRAGDILFAKRNAYLRRVAIAPHDGLFSAHGMILRPKPDAVLPEFLPLLMMSDKFMNRAVEISVGSLSPTINWTTLERQEFEVPPFDQQRRIAKVLWAVDEARQRATDLVSAAHAFELATLKHAFSTMTVDPRWNACVLGDLGELTIGQQKSPKFTKGRCPRPYLKVGNVTDGRLTLNSVEEMDFDEAALAKYRLNYGDILLTEGDLVSAANVGRSAMFRGELADCGYQNHLIRLRCGPNVLPEFALQLLRFMFHSGVFAKAAKRTTVVSLGIGRVAKVAAAIPPHSVQQSIAETMNRCDEVRSATESRAASGRMLISALLNSLL